MSSRELKFPFACELQEQHDALRAAMRWFDAETRRAQSGEQGHADPREYLRAFREQLSQHFRYEELNGFEGGFGSSDPEIQRWTRALIRQHRDFEARLGALLARAEAEGVGARLPALLLAELEALFRALRRHDAEENALMLWISRGPVDYARDVEPP